MQIEKQAGNTNFLFKVYYHTQYAFHTSGCKQTHVQSFIASFFFFPVADKEMKGNGLG